MAKSRIIRPSAPRQQHIVSKFYLEHFADRAGKLFVYEAKKPIRSSSPSREATERDFFEFKLPREKSSYQVEERLGKLETLAAPIHRKLVEGSFCTEANDILAWAFFVASTFLRSRRVRNELSLTALKSADAELLGEKHAREIQYEIFMKYGRLIPADEIAEATRRVRNEHEDPAFRHAHAIRNSTAGLAYVLSQKHWQVVEAHEDGFFATCDAPVLSFQLRGNELFDGYGWATPNVHIAFPLSPSRMFLASPPDVRWVPKMDCQNTTLMNLVVVRFADRFTYADRVSQELAASLDQHSKTMIFGENAFKVSPS